MKKIVKLCKKIVLIIIAIYAIVTFINQQKILNTYASNSKDLDSQIAEAEQYQNKLNETKEEINSDEYIEQMAREKLGMYKSNERVYINNQ